MPKLKLIQVMPEFGLAGAETMVESLIMSLDREKVDILIVSLYDFHSPITERLEKNGYKICYLNKKPGLDISIFSKMYNIFKEFKPDIIHTHRYVLQYVVLPKMLIKKCRIVHTVHNIAQKEVPKLQRMFQKKYFKYLKIIPVAISNLIQDTIIEEYKLKKEKVPVIINAIDLRKCIKKTKYKKSNIILNVGRLSEQKNHKLLIDVFNEIHKAYPKYILKIVGQGELEEELKKKVSDLGLKKSVIFEGVKPECFSYMNEADMFVMTSLWEGLPITLIEAMGTGLPIVTSNVGGIPDIIESYKNGIIVEGTIENFKKEIINLIEEESLRESIGKGSIESSKKYSAENMGKQYMKLYKEVLSKTSL